MKELKEPYQLALGKMTMNFSDLEVHLSWFLASLVIDDMALGQMLSSALPFRKRVDTLDSVYRHKVTDKNLLGEMAEVIALCQSCEDTRNRLIHSFWEPHVSEDSIQIVRSKEQNRRGRGFSIYQEHLTSVEIEQFAEEIREAKVRLLQLMIATQEAGIIRFFDKEEP